MSKDPSQRVKANRIMKAIKAGNDISEDDEIYITDYHGKPLDEIMAMAGIDPSDFIERNRSANASESIHIERKAAAAEGNHIHPDVYASMVRADGLRADTLINIVIKGLQAANQQTCALNAQLMERNRDLEESHIGFMNAITEAHLARTNAEAEQIKMSTLMQQAANGGEDGDSAMLEMLMRLYQDRQEQKQAEGGKKAKKKKPKGSKPIGVP